MAIMLLTYELFLEMRPVLRMDPMMWQEAERE
jgi:hypothetical protein